MRFFNTTGPVVPQDHYSIPPLARIDVDRVLRLVREKRYFVLHAPRQTGKTSALLAFQGLLNSGKVGAYRCVYVNVETAQAAGEDVQAGLRAILARLASRARRSIQDDFVAKAWRSALEAEGPHAALTEVLSEWAEADARPLVLLVDEIDSLVGDTLLAVLRQLRDGYDLRPHAFPQSIVLCGVRDVRDYSIRSTSRNEQIRGGSAFNIKAKSLRLGDFLPAEVEALLAQHTTETGQAFRPDALELVWARTQGQPWLVNALCEQACFESEQGLDRSHAIEVADILEAQEQLILERAVHLDQLADKLTEPRVKRVIEPLISGSEEHDYSGPDVQYVRDLGLIARDDPPRIANPIYAEVVPRELTAVTQGSLVQDPAGYVNKDGRLDLPRLLEAFQDFYRQHSEHWIDRYEYKEAAQQLLLQAFLQRIVNGGGRIEREYGLGRGRTDLLIAWPWKDGPSRYVIECKVLRASLETTISKGLEQTARYMDRCGAEAGHLVIFDRSATRWADKLFRRREMVDEVPIDVWGM